MSSFSEKALDSDSIKILKKLFKEGRTTYDNNSKEELSNFMKNFSMPRKPKMDFYKPGENPPKRACTPYIIFTSEFRKDKKYKAKLSKIRKEIAKQDLEPKDARALEVKMIADEWKKLSDDDKKVYENRSKADKKIYEKEKLKYDVKMGLKKEEVETDNETKEEETEKDQEPEPEPKPEQESSSGEDDEMDKNLDNDSD